MSKRCVVDGCTKWAFLKEGLCKEHSDASPDISTLNRLKLKNSVPEVVKCNTGTNFDGFAEGFRARKEQRSSEEKLLRQPVFSVLTTANIESGKVVQTKASSTSVTRPLGVSEHDIYSSFFARPSSHSY